MQKYYRRTTELSRTEYLENRREGVKTDLWEITLVYVTIKTKQHVYLAKLLCLNYQLTSQLNVFFKLIVLV